ncbi:MAG: tetratricopeptide repeat protein, partial [Acidobacteriales bacterium]|nr:tetratricopeptide repeat protein [Terriglobales bacterium]
MIHYASTLLLFLCSWQASALAYQQPAAPTDNSDPQSLITRERTFFQSGNYAQAAEAGSAAIRQSPTDRNAAVYLAYSLYNLGRTDEVLALASKYETILPSEPNFPLIEGHVHRKSQLLDEAIADYTRAIARDSNLVEAYVNRGFAYNDLHDPKSAIQDFNTALKLKPANGMALLGRSFAHLELKEPQSALNDAEASARSGGSSAATELAMATAYRQLRRFADASDRYYAALRHSPNDISLLLSLADTQFQSRKYFASISSLDQALKLDAHDPMLYAAEAKAYAALGDRPNTLSSIHAADENGGNKARVLVDTGKALLTINDRKHAMQRFRRALELPDSNPLEIRLALAQAFATAGDETEAKQQLATGLADARIGASPPPSPDDLVQAGDALLAMHDYNLAWQFYDRARQAGATDRDVAIGQANSFLQMGDYRNAESALAVLGDPADNTENYDYQLAMGNYYRDRADSARSMVAFARAEQMSVPSNDFRLLDAEREMAAKHGLNLSRNLTVFTESSFHPFFEDSTIYAIDTKLLPNTGSLPPLRYNYDFRQSTKLRYAPDNWIPITLSYGVRDRRGTFSYPRLNQIIRRNTVDFSLTTAVEPAFHFGNQTLMLNPGVEFTARRDVHDAVDLDQRLVRPFLSLETSPLFNWMIVRANGFRESGPFTYNSQRSTEYAGKIEFQVGRPWQKTALVTGYSADDIQFRPLVREFFSTSSYAGLRRDFGRRISVTGLAELVRSWRVLELSYAASQALQPSAHLDARLAQNWSLNAFGSWQSNKTVGAYDNVQSGFFISYTRPLYESANDGFGSVPVEIPMKLSFGL